VAVAATAVLTDMVPVVAVDLGQGTVRLLTLTQLQVVLPQPILAVAVVAAVGSVVAAVQVDLVL